MRHTPDSSEPLSELLQTTLGDSYIIERELTAGGMSRVFVANDRVLGRKVVVKVLPPDRALDISIERFRREIRVAAQLQHPNIVPLHTAGNASSALLYYIMPYVEGDSVRALMSRSAPRPVVEVVRILRDVASALAHAHERGVVHRDIKPENVLLSGGIAVVTDFGIAKALSDAHVTESGAANVPTAAGIAIGTLRYMAPEQAAGSATVDHRADIYALGAMAYELLSGVVPFEGRTPQGTLVAHIVEAPAELASLKPDVPPALAELVMRCLAKEPGDRPASASEIIAALDALGTPGDGTFKARPGMSATTWRSKRWRLIVPAAVAAAAVGAAVAIATSSARRADALPPDRVLVARFQNKTGDASLDAIADVAADWITRGLTTSSVAEVILAPDTGAAATTDARALARTLGAGTVVAGSYYRQGDSVYMTAILSSVATGAVSFTIGPIAALVSRPFDAVEPLRQRVAGALALATDPDKASALPTSVISPPRYDAYREFVLGTEAAERLDQQKALTHHLRAVQLDPDFHLAALDAAVAYENLGDCVHTDSIIRAVLAKRERLTEWESNYAERILSWCTGDWATFHRTGLRSAQLAPKSTIAKFMAARSALFVRRRTEAIASLKKLDPERGPLMGNMQYHDDLNASLHLIGEYEDQLRQVQRTIRLFPGRVHPLWHQLQALAGLRRGDEAERVLEKALSMRPAPGDAETPPVLMHLTALEFRAHGDTVRSARLNARALAWHRAQPREGGRIPNDDHYLVALYLAGQYREARAVADSAMRGVESLKPRYYSWMGRLAARLGDTATARSAMDTLATVAERPFERGASHYSRARIAAVLGERDESVRLLRESFARGALPQQYFRAHAEPDFDTLRGWAPFDALVRAQE